jgi:hypothetical protein
MATQICPNCKNDAFTWSINEDYSSLTYWFCFKCRYDAYEDESQERICTVCDKKTESRLQDKKQEYWWCSNCNSIKLIE